jgi:hypothetical protein
VIHRYAASAASASATFFDPPLPLPASSASNVTTAVNTRAWSGPVCVIV